MYTWLSIWGTGSEGASGFRITQTLKIGNILIQLHLPSPCSADLTLLVLTYILKISYTFYMSSLLPSKPLPSSQYLTYHSIQTPGVSGSCWMKWKHADADFTVTSCIPISLQYFTLLGTTATSLASSVSLLL